MKNLFDNLGINDLLNIKTVEEAKKYVLANPQLQMSAETMAFRQTILNILLVAGLVTENDFNAALEHFKDEANNIFASKLLEEVKKANEELKDLNLDQLKKIFDGKDDDEEDEKPDWGNKA